MPKCCAVFRYVDKLRLLFIHASYTYKLFKDGTHHLAIVVFRNPPEVKGFLVGCSGESGEQKIVIYVERNFPLLTASLVVWQCK